MIAEAERLAYADRDKYVADPDFVPLPGNSVDTLLDEQYLKQRAAMIDPNRSMGTAKPGDLGPVPLGVGQQPPEHGTAHISIVDRYGNAAAMTTSVEGSFGSYHFVDGFLLNNQLTDFAAQPTGDDGVAVANRIEAGKRPRSSMSPTLVFDRSPDGSRGQLSFVTGSPGGALIIQFVVKTIVCIVDWGLDPQQAVSSVNFGAANSPTTGVGGEHPAIDAMDNGDHDPLVQRLREMGHQVSVAPQSSGLSVVARDGEGLIGGADPRREGAVAGDAGSDSGTGRIRNMKIMVTGGTGFVGSHATAALMQSRPRRAFVGTPPRPGASLVRAIRCCPDRHRGRRHPRRGAISRALEGCDAVLHSAAVYSLNPADAEVMGKTNVAAAQSVLGAASARRLDPIIHISSTVALTRYGGTDASLPLGDVELPYSRSKIESEKVARALQGQGAAVVTVYPGTVYGPDDPYNGEQTERVKWILRGAMATFPKGGAHAVDVREVAAVIAAAMEPGHGARRLVVPGTHVGADVCSTPSTAQRADTSPTSKLPAGLLRPAVKMIGAVQPKLPGDWHFPADLEGVELSIRDTRFDSLFDETLGVRARPFIDTITDQIAWMARTGRIPARHAGVLADR